MKYIISLVIFCSTVTGTFAQEAFVPSAIRLGIDLSRIGISLIDPGRRQFEINADTDIENFFLVFDYGMAESEITSQGYSYNMNGSWIRLGADYNFLFNDPDDHVIFFGLKYGTASFSEKFLYEKENIYFGNYGVESAKPDNSAGWLEANAGMKVHVWKQLYLGWTARLKFGLTVNAPGDLVTYEIPGYGLADKKSRYGINYSVYYRLPFRDKPPPAPKKKKKGMAETG